MTDVISELIKTALASLPPFVGTYTFLEGDILELNTKAINTQNVCLLDTNYKLTITPKFGDTEVNFGLYILGVTKLDFKEEQRKGVYLACLAVLKRLVETMKGLCFSNGFNTNGIGIRVVQSIEKVVADRVGNRLSTNYDGLFVREFTMKLSPNFDFCLLTEWDVTS